ncbi:pseudouridine synthase [Candidatus Woesearchaeota archaeon CG_4_10_14_0_2_um_filter_33_13]|nr:MAG: pseudouridine synthase [Candidatus Woesearchaeota archaeon CG_4_10_14_0_2_um_filter_33_13]
MDRVQKIICNAGYCSRRKAEELIQAGRVKVNGKSITIGDQASETDEIRIDNKPIVKERRVYLMFNKPGGCVTALTDPQLRTVADYIRIPERVFPVGRLDYDTTGLLLLTNDGDLANLVMHPRNEVKKTYLVKLDVPIKDEQIKLLERGIVLKDGKTSPAKVKRLSPIAFEITIHEGKNQIIKRMVRKLGFFVRELKRISIGQLELGGIKLGEYKEVSRKELEKIFTDNNKNHKHRQS